MMPSSVLVRLLAISVPLFAASLGLAFGSALAPAKLAAWWNVGETVEFRMDPQKVDARLKALVGEVGDSNGRKVDSVRIGRDELLARGWRWTPREPGYYEVRFSADLGSQAVPLAESYALQAPNGKTASFSREVYSFAVVPPAAPHPASGQFGFHYHLKQEHIPLAKLVGFDFAFIHSVPWGGEMADLSRAIQPQRDQWDWAAFDRDVQALTDAGFELGAQFLYTPAWASPHPELADKVNICVRGSAAYAPTDIADFSRFVDRTVRRYGDRIKIWEMWNEPNISGGSCYWSDTPENYVKLLRAGYQAVKEAQPEGQVWLGGLGPRKSYYAFYDQILKAGAGGLYDRLSVHGFWPDIDDFREIETRNGAAHPPAVLSEWHAILLGTVNPGSPSEGELGLRMMGDLLHQLKQGVLKTVFFEVTDLVEPEDLGFAQANQWFVHSSGLFRTRPRVEPRLPAVIMANFLRLSGGSAKFVKELAVPDGGFGGQLSTANGDLAVFWNPAKPLDAATVAAYAAPQSSLMDWEGRRVEAGGKTLAAGKVYYLLAPDPAALQGAGAVDRLKAPPRMGAAEKGPLEKVKAGYRKGKLLDASGALLEGNVPWIDQGWKRVSLQGLPGKEAFSARAAVGADSAGLDIVVEVHDATHSQNEPPETPWNGDSLQVAIDCENSGVLGGNTEIVAALTPAGPAVRKVAAASLRGDLPTQWSPAGSPLRFAESWITRQDSTTSYRLRIPWSELYPLADDAGPLRVALLVNDNDGAGRAGWLEWGGGIGAVKDPARYGTLEPAR